MPVIRAEDVYPVALPGRHSGDPLPHGFDGGCAVRIVEIPPGARTPHRHPHSAEVVYVAAGSGVAWEAGTVTPVRAGDVIAIPAGVPHATAAAETLRLVCFFPHEDLSSNLEELDEPTVTA